ncbi:hypothetical protein T552_02429 [Pneumocystis carinii B80]|uniref:Major surface glycoprotein 2 C-terminal domain-containing protein n=1 Tax=Pneumocystis carinii (strain B80) TaxID=1408658 RepID=A0A0W4ZEY1_PNEC8|nr:hypothetical protein T552_02429 [Pneumocystis carinii B80]KTW26940.1 hypothetical protein T552_02429 [Pneumocystis carinii B80]
MRKTIFSVLFIGFSYVISKNIASGSLDISFDADDAFLYLLKGNTAKNNCEKVLKEYCSLLKNYDDNFNELCNNNNICDKLGNNDYLKEKCKVLEKLETGFSDNCDNLLAKCFFLESSCPNVASQCSTIRDVCYGRTYEEFADRLILRLVHNSFGDSFGCQSKIQEYCPSLASKTPELLLKCLNTKETCEKLTSFADNICISLKDAVTKVNGNHSLLNKTCSLLLEECHYYLLGCKPKHPELDSLCQNLKQSCGDVGIVFSLPSAFNPIEPSLSILTRLGADNLILRAEESGIEFIDNFSYHNIDFFLALLTEGIDGGTTEDKCKNALNQKCSSISHLSDHLTEFCKKKDDYNNKCKALEENLTKIIKQLKESYQENFKKKDQNNDGTNLAIPWTSLPALSKNNCNFFLTQLACHKKTRNNYNKTLLQNILEGHLNIASHSTSSCVTRLRTECKISKLYTRETFEICFDLKKTCRNIVNFIKGKCEDLLGNLNTYLEYPDNSNCDLLESQCSSLALHCPFIARRCYIFSDNCDKYKKSVELKYVLSSQGGYSIGSMNTCLRSLNDKCGKLVNQCNIMYVDQGRSRSHTCKVIVSFVWTNCLKFLQNFRSSGILKEQYSITSDECFLWRSYCNMLVNSCIGGLKSSCSNLNEKCKKFFELETFQTALYNDLGKFKDENECVTLLSNYCKKPKNQSLNDLCKEYSEENAQKKLCQEFVSRLTKQCSVLSDELRRINVSLTKSISLVSDKLILKGTTFMVELSIKIKTECDRLLNQCDILDSCDNIKKSCEHIKTLCEKFKEFDLSSGLVTITVTSMDIHTHTHTEVMKVTNIVTDSKSTTQATTLRNAAIRSNTVSNWPVLYLSTIIAIFVLVFS